MRQALFGLQQEGYVEVLFCSGWRVLAFNFEQFEQLYDLRMVLETTAIDRLAEGLFQSHGCHSGFSHDRQFSQHCGQSKLEAITPKNKSYFK